MIDQHTVSGEKVKALASDLKIDTPDRLDDTAHGSDETSWPNSLAQTSIASIRARW